MSNRGTGRGPQKLTNEQQIRLDAVSRADQAWRDAKRTLRARLRLQLEEELMRYSMARDEAVYDAVQAGVPKTRISSEALATSPNAVYDSVERHQARMGVPGLPELAEKPKPLYEWEELETHNGITFWALHDTTTDHTAGIVKNDFYPATITVENGWLYARNTDKNVGMWLDGKPSLEVTTWVEANEPW